MEDKRKGFYNFRFIFAGRLVVRLTLKVNYFYIKVKNTKLKFTVKKKIKFHFYIVSGLAGLLNLLHSNIVICQRR